MRTLLLCLALLLLLSPGNATADLSPGLIADFDDGTLQGWATPRFNTSNVAGGPTGNFLQVAPAPNLAAHNASINGLIDASITAISVDMMRPAEQSALEMRLVLFGPGTTVSWTSSVAEMLPGDGLWRTFVFSILEEDLTQVQGATPYADLLTDLNRIMFRNDPGPPSANGTPGTGTFGMDNIFAVPEPSGFALFSLVALAGLASRARRAVR